MNKPGKTPLFRAKNLEQYLGIKQIYFKLEGTNPFGHKYDRVSEVIVKDALHQKKNGLLVDGSYDYINSMVRFCEEYALDVKIPLFSKESWKTKSFDSGLLLDFTNTDRDKKYGLVDDYCRNSGLYNASNQYANMHLSMIALQKIGEEIAEKLGDNISTVFIQLSYGYTVSSLYNGFMNKWVEGSINRYPQIFSCTIPKGNTIYDDYKRNMEIRDLEDYDIKINKYTRHLFTGKGALLEDTLKAVRDTKGKIISVNENLLKESVKILKHKENILLSVEEGYSFAGFYKLAMEDGIKNGKHVIVLNNGKSDLRLQRIADFKEYSRDTISRWIKEWLQEYSDPIEETEDAVQAAVRTGFILLALRNNTPQGICVVVNLGFKEFIPTYHLAYICTKEGNKGRGIATELINEMIQLTKGKLSLHVDLDNRRAKKLYRKLGFETAYYRMIYSEEQ